VKLTEEQRARVREDNGVCAEKACDGCGKLLGYVRYTRCGEPGSWCSETCRDGREIAEARKQRRESGAARRAALNGWVGTFADAWHDSAEGGRGKTPESSVIVETQSPEGSDKRA
jgi:hypothetical protein